MGTLAKNYRIKVVDPEGTIIKVIDLLEYNLDKPIARASIMNEIQEAIDRELNPGLMSGSQS